MRPWLVMLRLGWNDLWAHRRLTVVMAVSIAIATGALILLEVYRAGLSDKFVELAPNWLVAHEPQSFGEVYGSRLPVEVYEQLVAQGVQPVIPEIYAITGTAVRNAVLLRGVDLQYYTLLEPFQILAGRALAPGDQPRLAMVGWRLAESRQVRLGDDIWLRGRPFRVVGIFKNGTYMDNQAWIAIEDAQTLLGWGSDVSVYIVPQAQGLQPPQGVMLSPKGETLRYALAQIQPLFDLMSVVLLVMTAAAALALANILWRVAWLHRREVAILRTVGFPAASTTGYLLVQALSITLLGVLLGGMFALAFTSSVRLLLPSFTIVPRLLPQRVLAGLAGVICLLLAGSLIPAVWLSRLNLAQCLHSESMKQEVR